jgi:NAD(P)-dependent dehydrogenase (short-subunit alcohol dehydrogenase family)
VFEVLPGAIRMPMTAGVASKHDQRIAKGLVVPTGRRGDPHYAARAVAALASQ